MYKPMYKPYKVVSTLWLNPKLIINFLYSIFVNMFFSFRNFYRFKVIADFGSTISKAHSAKLIIDKRLYLGGKYIGDMTHSKAYIRMYKNSTFHVKGRVKFGPGIGIVVGPNAKLSIGDNTYITASSVIYCNNEMEIGRDCAIAWNTTIIDTDFHQITYPDGTQNPISSPVKIGDKVWIGCNSTILKGVTIGNNCVIGANTLVNKDVPANCLVAGNPMRIVKEGIDWNV